MSAIPGYTDEQIESVAEACEDGCYPSRDALRLCAAAIRQCQAATPRAEHWGRSVTAIPGHKPVPTDVSAPETRVLRCQPGDVVILHYRDNVPIQTQMQNAGQFASTLPDGVQVAVEAGNVDIIRSTPHDNDPKPISVAAAEHLATVETERDDLLTALRSVMFAITPTRCTHRAHDACTDCRNAWDFARRALDRTTDHRQPGSNP